jgi:hypothetical protein
MMYHKDKSYKKGMVPREQNVAGQVSRTSVALCAICLLVLSCAQQPAFRSFAVAAPPETPAYGHLTNWAAHPDKEDPSDICPAGMNDTTAQGVADVFFIHPTTYTGSRDVDKWNASVHDPEINTKTDDGTIRLQASAFSGAGHVWAPRYRQAHYHAFFTEDTASAKRALEIAYKDVKQAFEHFLTARPDPLRPIVIAGHSQGAFHGKRLVVEFFDDTPITNLLVAAYLVGYRVSLDEFNTIGPCIEPSQTNCLVGWRTFKKGHDPEWMDQEPDNILVTNPLNWTCEDGWVDKTENDGGVFSDFGKIRSQWVGAGVHKNILWTDKPRFPGSFLLFSRNYHAGDINLFYVNIYNNCRTRVNAWYQNNID